MQSNEDVSETLQESEAFRLSCRLFCFGLLFFFGRGGGGLRWLAGLSFFGLFAVCVSPTECKKRHATLEEVSTLLQKVPENTGDS